MSSHTSVDTPSNKINRGQNFKKGSNNNRSRQRFRTPSCFACGDPNHRIKDCTNKAKKDEWIAKRQEKQKNERALQAKANRESQEHGKPVCLYGKDFSVKGYHQ